MPSKGRKTTTQVQKVDIPSFAQPAFSRYASELGRYNTDSVVPGFTPEQLQAQDIFRSYARDRAPQVADSVQRNLDFLSPSQVFNNPHLDNVIEGTYRKLDNNYLDVTLPALRGAEVNAGNLGSSRGEIAEALTASRLAETKANVAARTYADNYNRGIQTLLQLTPQLQALQANAHLGGANVLQSLGGQLQTQQQREALGVYDQLARYGSLLGGLAPTLGGSGQQTVPETGLSPISGAIGGGTLGYALAGAAKGGFTGPGGAVLGALAGAGLSYL